MSPSSPVLRTRLACHQSSSLQGATSLALPQQAGRGGNAEETQRHEGGGGRNVNYSKKCKEHRKDLKGRE
jgi:hypothetical protein